MKKTVKIIIALAIVAVMSCIAAIGVFADEEITMHMANDKLVPEESIEVIIDFSEDYELCATDWVNVYPSAIDVHDAHDGDGMGLWTYVGTNTRESGIPESRHVELALDEDIAEAGWPLPPGDYNVILFSNDTYEYAAHCSFTIEDDSIVVTPAPDAPEATDEPTAEPTSAPTTEPTAAPTSEPAPAEKKGCGSVVLSSAAVIAMAAAGCAVILRKKH